MVLAGRAQLRLLWGRSPWARVTNRARPTPVSPFPLPSSECVSAFHAAARTVIGWADACLWGDRNKHRPVSARGLDGEAERAELVKLVSRELDHSLPTPDLHRAQALSVSLSKLRIWSGWLDLNQRPPHSKCGTLPLSYTLMRPNALGWVGSLSGYFGAFRFLRSVGCIVKLPA